MVKIHTENNLWARKADPLTEEMQVLTEELRPGALLPTEKARDAEVTVRSDEMSQGSIRSSVECNAQILEALKVEAKKADFRMKDVSKDILKAATIIIKSLTALDKIAQDDGHEGVAHEVDMISGALALLGNANHRNNLTRRFIIKREINPRYTHLCSDKVPMTRFLFGDDVSQSAKQNEESEKLKNKITTKKLFTT